jgi:hypothetical protein
MAKDKSGKKNGKAQAKVPRSAEPADSTTSPVPEDHLADDHHGTHHVATLVKETPTEAATRLVDRGLPSTRAELELLHQAARRRRAAASLGSDEYRAAVDEIWRIEVRIASVEEASPTAS